ncbi:acyltransferase [Cohnella faecalis]|uniref:acyltransferase n=1 Tax=Cohnella faecalis TaxID=2315694 RepID=UPI0013148543|nr:acyltransferase [Cohnella faecalis]
MREKKKINEINIVRAFAILAVLIIHATAGARSNVPWGSASSPFYITVNQLSTFAVPLFIMITGLVLFYRYYDNWTWEQALTFYKKRIQYIVLPYLIWSIFYYVYNQAVYNHEVSFDIEALSQQLLWGRAGYHLYFMVIIIQFYAAFPLILTLFRKMRLSARKVIGAGLLVQTVFYILHYWIGPFAHKAALMPNYFLVFCVGAAIGMSYQRFTELAGHLWWTFAASVAVGFTTVLIGLASRSGAHYWPPVYAVLFNLYAILVGFSALWIAQKLDARASAASKLANAFGALAFGIYLIHPAVLTLWRQIYNPDPQQSVYHLYNLASLMIIIIVPWAVAKLIKQSKHHWLLFGKS